MRGRPFRSRFTVLLTAVVVTITALFPSACRNLEEVDATMYVERVAPVDAVPPQVFETATFSFG